MISTKVKPNGVEKTTVDSHNTLGRGSFFTGDIKTNSNVRLEGEIDGNVESKDTVIIGKPCVCKGEIKGRVIHVEGKVDGELLGQELVRLTATAIVNGFISAPKLEVDAGAHFMGKVKMS